MGNNSKPDEDRDSQAEFLRPPIENKESRWGFRGKTVWDWMQLFIVPLALALIGLWFTAQQDNRQRQQQIAEAKQARQIEEQRTQDAALQAYLDQMSTLLLTENGLRSSKEGSEVRTLARARTLTVLDRLGKNDNAPNMPDRKRNVVQFLYEAKLIQSKGTPVIDLDGADLSHTDLSKMRLEDVNLNDTNLTNATFSSGQNLSGAWMGNANLTEADLEGVNLDGAYLDSANLTGTDLTGVKLSDSTDLTGSYKVTNEDEGTQRLVTKEELEARGVTLVAGATMPNGQKYQE